MIKFLKKIYNKIKLNRKIKRFKKRDPHIYPLY